MGHKAKFAMLTSTTLVAFQPNSHRLFLLTKWEFSKINKSKWIVKRNLQHHLLWILLQHNLLLEQPSMLPMPIQHWHQVPLFLLHDTNMTQLMPRSKPNFPHSEAKDFLERAKHSSLSSLLTKPTSLSARMVKKWDMKTNVVECNISFAHDKQAFLATCSLFWLEKEQQKAKIRFKTNF